MAIQFTCSCGKQYTVADSAAGKLVLCKVCNTRSRIPQPEPVVDDAEVIDIDADPFDFGEIPAAAMRLSKVSSGSPPDRQQKHFDGFGKLGGKLRRSRVYCVADELLVFDIGPYSVDPGKNVAVTGAMQGGAVGGLIGAGIGAVMRKKAAADRKKCDQRLSELQNLTLEMLRREVDQQPTNRKIASRQVDNIHFRERSTAWDEKGTVGRVNLAFTDEGSQKLTIKFDDLKEMNSAVKCLQSSCGAQRVKVDVPLTQDALDAAEKGHNTKILVGVAIFAALALGLAYVIGSVFNLRGDAPIANQFTPAKNSQQVAIANNATASGGEAATSPTITSLHNGAFSPRSYSGQPIIPLNPTAAEQLELEYAKQPPAFDPSRPPTIRNGMADRLRLTTLGVDEDTIDWAERLASGQPSDGSETATKAAYHLIGAIPDPWIDRAFENKNTALPWSDGNTPPDTTDIGAQWETLAPTGQGIDVPLEKVEYNLPLGIPSEGDQMRAPYLFAVSDLSHRYLINFASWLSWRDTANSVLVRLKRDPKNENRYIGAKEVHPQPPHQVIDLTTGKVEGEFDWRAPTYLGGRLSPDGQYVVGPDSTPLIASVNLDSNVNYENGLGTLYVWQRGKDRPTPFKVPGIVRWIEFVSNTKIALLTDVYPPEEQKYQQPPTPKFSVHDIVTQRTLFELQLPEHAVQRDVATKPPGRHIFDASPTYHPLQENGAVSGGGKYVALYGGKAIVLISIADQKVIGTFAGSELKHVFGMNFAPESDRLFAVAYDQNTQRKLNIWSTRDGSLSESILTGDEAEGMTVAGPAAGLYLSGPVFVYDKTLLGWDKIFNRPIALDSTGKALVLLPWKEAPAETPLPKFFVGHTKQTYPNDVEEMMATHRGYTFYHIPIDWSEGLKGIQPIEDLLRPRPDVPPGDRADVQPTKPQPPAEWTPVPNGGIDLPAPDRLPDERRLDDWPNAMGKTKFAYIRYRYQDRRLWSRSEVYLDVWDAATAKPLGKPVQILPWAAKFWRPVIEQQMAKIEVLRPNPPRAMAALSPDDNTLALVDPNDPRRIDFFDTTQANRGQRVGEGFLAYPVEQIIDWIGWATDDRLLTIAGGTLSCWDPTTQKAHFEVAGNYTHRCIIAPNKQWLVAWAVTHADVLEISTGKCLARLQVGGCSGDLVSFELAPDAKKLLACFDSVPHTLSSLYPSGLTTAYWNLQTGQSGIFVLEDKTDAEIHGTGGAVWISNDHILGHQKLVATSGAIFDTKAGTKQAVSNRRYSITMARDELRQAPDGSLWYGGGSHNPNSSNQELYFTDYTPLHPLPVDGMYAE